MNHLLVLLAAFAAAATLFVNQRAELAKVQRANRLVGTQQRALSQRLTELEQRRAQAQSALSESQERIASIRRALVATPAPKPEPIVPPDPTHQGGWPAKAPYFYLPKKVLGAVGYPLFAGHALTDEAATLFGLSAAEREAVDTAYSDLWHKFRQLETQRMEPVEPPTDFDPTHRPDGVAYRIPSLAKEAQETLGAFTASLQAALGPTRAAYLMETAQTYLANRLDDLGQNARVIAFWPASIDGKQSAAYAIKVEGVGADWRAIQSPLDKDSSEAYYARLFGVDVPIQD